LRLIYLTLQIVAEKFLQSRFTELKWVKRKRILGIVVVANDVAPVGVSRTCDSTNPAITATLTNMIIETII
jgi:hypothetical protein